MDENENFSFRICKKSVEFFLTHKKEKTLDIFTLKARYYIQTSWFRWMPWQIMEHRVRLQPLPQGEPFVKRHDRQILEGTRCVQVDENKAKNIKTAA